MITNTLYWRGGGGGGGGGGVYILAMIGEYNRRNTIHAKALPLGEE